MGKAIDLLGQEFSRLTVIAYEGRTKRGNQCLWRCRCLCGNEKVVRSHHLRSGKIRSCGCLHREVIRNQPLKIRHGHANSLPNKRATRTYQSWRSMIDRCCNANNPAYARYGGRGIRICHEWRNSFPTFLLDLGERPNGMSLDRIDPNGDYKPGNVRWATPKEQNDNQRLSHSRVRAILAKYEVEAPDLVARLRIELLGWQESTRHPLRTDARHA